MGGSQSYSVRSRLQICDGAIRLFVMSATEDARYVSWSHRGCLVHSMEDAHIYTRVTTIRRLRTQPAVCTLGLGEGATPNVSTGFNSNTPLQIARLQRPRKVSWRVSFMQVQRSEIWVMFCVMMLAGVIS